MSDKFTDDDSIDSIESVEDITESVIDIKPIRSVPRSRPSFQEPDITRQLTKDDGTSVCSLQLYKENPYGNSSEDFPSVIPLNVGGIKYITRLSTLRKFPDSLLSLLFSGRYKVDKDAEGNYFLDSNGGLFCFILEYLRNGTLPPKDMTAAVYKEAGYYGIYDLVEKLKFSPPVVSHIVKEANKSQFPNYAEAKNQIIKAAMENATFTKIGEVIVHVGEVIIHVFKEDFVPKVHSFNPNHGCVIEGADVIFGPWSAPADEEMFMRCLENDLTDEGFVLRPHEPKRKCRYYHGQSCLKFVYRLQIVF
ncbi:hypothetical protein ACJMK2_011672 [Sinanodonta woodiana]|uniref:Uncharacterized protein n=1 Tax=Sinanodonta woodiana TaxID=1069815 RepID=A0ABD3V7H6_SINWO